MIPIDALRGLRWPDGRLTDISRSTQPRDGAELVEVSDWPAEDIAYSVLGYDAKTKQPILHAATASRDAKAKAFVEWRRERDLLAYEAATGLSPDR